MGHRNQSVKWENLRPNFLDITVGLSDFYYMYRKFMPIIILIITLNVLLFPLKMGLMKNGRGEDVHGSF